MTTLLKFDESSILMPTGTSSPITTALPSSTLNLNSWSNSFTFKLATFLYPTKFDINS